MVFEFLLDLMAYLVESTPASISCLAERPVALPLSDGAIADVFSLSLTPMGHDTAALLLVLTRGDVCSLGFDHSARKFRDMMISFLFSRA